MRNLFLFFLIFLSFPGTSQNSKVNGYYEMEFDEAIGDDGCCRYRGYLTLNDNHTFFIKRLNDQGEYQCYEFSCGTFEVRGDRVLLLSQIPDSIKQISERQKVSQVGDNEMLITFYGGRRDLWRAVYMKFHELTDLLAQNELTILRTEPPMTAVMDHSEGESRLTRNNFDTIKFWIRRPVTKNVLISNKFGYALTLNEKYLENRHVMINYGLNKKCEMSYFDFTGIQFEIKFNRLVGLKPGIRARGKEYRVMYYRR